MSNSSLVSYTKLSPFRTIPRNHKIDTITIHCYVAQVSVENAGAWFSNPKAKCSCNYVIGSDGRIGLIVPEGDRSWCSSNAANDHRAVTIECASDSKSPYAINDKVYASLIKLCADICKRNNIKELKWQADKKLIGQVDKQNMTVHRWFHPMKSCPGKYIYDRLGQIANDVNDVLDGVKPSNKTQEDNFLPARGYFKKGDISPNIGKIATFMRKMFPSYTNKKALGNTYGQYLVAAITEFQKRTGLEADGYIGPLTVKKLEEYGFKK